MRRRSTQLLLGALLLPLGATPVVATLPASASEPGAPAHSSPAAERALDRALALVEGHRTRTRGTSGAAEQGDATMALLDLRRQYDRLDSGDQATARRIFARPNDDDDPGEAAQGWSYDTAERAAMQEACTDHFCVHWVPAGTLDDSGAASRHGATQAYVNAVTAALTRSWDVEVTRMGYDRPPGDGADGGGTDLVDAYLVDTASPDMPVMGYAQPEDNCGFDASAGIDCSGYLTLDNDMTEVVDASATASQLISDVAAHEFFHLVQFGYDVEERDWLYESTAAWMQEQVFDATNTNRGMLPYSSMRNTWLPLDEANGGTEYGNWVFHQLTTERLGQGTMLHVWRHAAAHTGDNTRSALDAAYHDAGSSFLTEFKRFTAASLAPSRYWAEGGSFGTSARMARTFTLGTSKKSTGWWWVSNDHLASAAFEVKPGPSLTGKWKLRITADPRATSYNTGNVMVVYRDGTVTMSSLAFRGGDRLIRNVPFSNRKIRRVVVSLGNASGGNDRKTDFRFSIWR